MSTYKFGGFIVLIGILIVVFVYSFQKIAVADSDNETGLENAARNAMTEAVNLGNARVNEEVTINEEIATESLLRQYADTTDFDGADRYLNVYQVNSDPAMIAVDSYLTVQTPIQSMLNRFTDKNRDDTTIGRSREVIIWEAKSTTR